tara:strand:- start:169 stop:705 length:537 start_codon:yes stop_codon:yes gene_type:complete
MISTLQATFYENEWIIIDQRTNIVEINDEFEKLLNEYNIFKIEELLPEFWNLMEQHRWSVYHRNGTPTERTIANKIQQTYGKPINISYNKIDTIILCDNYETCCEKNDYYVTAIYSDYDVTKETLIEKMKNIQNMTKNEFISKFYELYDKEGWSMKYNKNKKEINDKEFIESYYREFE